MQFARDEVEPLRVSRPGEPELFGKKLCNIAWTIYGAAGTTKPTKAKDLGKLAELPFIGWFEDVMRATKWSTPRTT